MFFPFLLIELYLIRHSTFIIININQSKCLLYFVTIHTLWHFLNLINKSSELKHCKPVLVAQTICIIKIPFWNSNNVQICLSVCRQFWSWWWCEGGCWRRQLNLNCLASDHQLPDQDQRRCSNEVAFFYQACKKIVS